MAFDAKFSRDRLEYSETAVRKDIDNRMPLGVMKNGMRLSDTLSIIEAELKKLFGADFHLLLSSAYRCPTLNTEIGGAAGSYHKLALAADLRSNSVAPRELAAEIQKLLVSGAIVLDKIILEFNRWVHVQLPQDGRTPSKTTQSAVKRMNTERVIKTVYLPGLVTA